MPPRKFYKKKPMYRKKPAYRKKTYTKSRFTKNVARQRQPGTLIAPRYLTKLVYCDRLAIPSTITTDISSCYQFRLNSIYDPDLTSTGHQPLGRDQLALLYNRYRVFAVDWQITVFPVNFNSQGSISVVARNDDVPMSGLALSTIREELHCMTKPTSLNNPVIFKGRISNAKLQGVTSQEYKGNDGNQNIFSTNCTELQTLSICMSPIAGSTAGPYPFDIRLVYHTECFDPIVLTQS